jgi:hypothetical protein
MARTQGDGAVVNTDPRDTLATSPMSQLQWVVVALTVALNALDVYDILSILYPPVSPPSGINRRAQPLSMELIGMAINKWCWATWPFGRRPKVLGCLVVMAEAC